MILTQPDRDRLVALLHSHRSSRPMTATRRSLMREVDAADVVDPSMVPENVVTMNSVVSLIDLATGRISTYALVYPLNENIARLRVSVLTPLGAALLGRAVGEIIECDVPSGTTKYFIRKVTFQPERRLRLSRSESSAA